MEPSTEVSTVGILPHVESSMVTEASDEAYSVNLIGGFRCAVGDLVPVLCTLYY